MGSLRLRSGLVAIALALVAAHGALQPSPASAQTITTAAIRGVVRDSAGGIVRGAEVTLTHRATGWVRAVASNSGGEYRSSALPPGSYDVRVEQLGYRPLLVLDVTLGPGAAVSLDLALTPAEPPVTQVDTLSFVEGAVHASLARGSWDPGRDLVDLVDPLGRIASLAAVASASLNGLSMGGLPDRMGVPGLDGAPSRAAADPDVAGGALSTLGLPFVTLDHAELASGADVEWSGYGGGLLSAFSARAPRATQVRAYGDGANGSYRGGFQVGGPLVKDSAWGLIGVDARRVETQYDAPWANDSAHALLAAYAQDSLGADLSGYLRKLKTRADAVTAFGRFDWQIAAGQSVALRAAVTNTSVSDAPLGATRFPGLGTSLDARDVSGSLFFNSHLVSPLSGELSVAVTRSQRDYGAPPLPGTELVEQGAAAGADGAVPGQFERDQTRASGALRYRLGGHELKAGLVLSWTSHDISYDPWRAGVFAYGSAADFAQGIGSFTQSLGGVPAASFSIDNTAFFLQDSWLPAPDLTVLYGVRIERESWPTGGVATDAEWARLTGLSNSTVPRLKSQVSPRVAFTWSAGTHREWLLKGDAGVYAEGVDPAVLAEVLTHDGTSLMRRGLGTVGGWPGTPDSTAAPVTGAALTLLNPGFEAPRTGRASLGVARELATGVSLQVTGQYRHTDFLARRSDLNLAAAPQATDEYGRPVYGTLQQFGSLVAATPGSNRRFAGFDRVWALDPSGFSDYWGVSAAFESLRDQGLSLWASYTYSRTTDNLPGLLGTTPDAQLSPFPAGSPMAGWSNGTSDLDVPHRVAVGAQLAFGAVRLEGLVRWRSGLPFTPGFRDGVDANGDGASNDPAFVSDTVSGIAPVLGKWQCLRSQIGQFAGRNSCRGPSVTSVDARVSVSLGSLASGAPVEVFGDGVNLVTSNDGVVDRALFLVDPTRATTTSAGVVNVPLVANPNFGKLLYRWAPTATVRAGVRVEF